MEILYPYVFKGAEFKFGTLILETIGSYKQVDFLFLAELTREKFQIEFFSYNKLTFCSNNVSWNVLQQPYVSIWI